jgi:hypothetical protein
VAVATRGDITADVGIVVLLSDPALGADVDITAGGPTDAHIIVVIVDTNDRKRGVI